VCFRIELLLVVLFWKNSVFTRVMHSQCPLCPAGIGNTVDVSVYGSCLYMRNENK